MLKPKHFLSLLAFIALSTASFAQTYVDVVNNSPGTQDVQCDFSATGLQSFWMTPGNTTGMTQVSTTTETLNQVSGHEMPIIFPPTGGPWHHDMSSTVVLTPPGLLAQTVTVSLSVVSGANYYTVTIN